ncbi:hypothetical protein ACTMTJ_08885 [Phytohabitans sp. LJ34]|uniref:hypothetical protein n=1 Tax=Phytohabitans sp. LJ34 TaxID=3452217 RepID=UPI003F8C8839
MTRDHRLRRLLLASLAVVAVLAAQLAVPAGVTNAATRPPVDGLPPGLVWSSCATGAITEYSVTVEPGPPTHTRIAISGWAQPCAGTSPNTFAIVKYGMYATLSPAGLRRYESLTAPTAFRVFADYWGTSSDAFPSGTGICLHRTLDGRLACLAVGVLGDTGQLVASLVPPAEIPARPLVVYSDPDPNCGMCL